MAVSSATTPGSPIPTELTSSKNKWINVDRVNFIYDCDSLGRVEDKKMYGNIVDAYGRTETTVKVYKTAQSEATAT